jgi:hypothetical protein
MNFLKNANPVGAIADFREVFRSAGNNRWWIAIVAFAITIGLFSTMAWEVWYKPPPKPEVTWITSYAPDRTEAEIVASNIANQKRKDALAAEQAKREEEVRNIYRKIGAASGMDVAKVEREAAAERAAAETKRKREQAEALERLRQSELAGKR